MSRKTGKSKVCINSVFVHGFFKVKAPYRIRKPEKLFKLLAGNDLEIFFNVRSYTLRLKKNIEYYLFHQNLRTVVEKHIQDISEWKITNTTAKITNFQGSICVSNCSFRTFHRYFLPFLLQTLSVDFIGLGFERNETIIERLKPEQFLTNPKKTYGYLTLDLGNEEKFKIQPNDKKKQVQISFVFTHFPVNLQEAVKTLQTVADFFETSPTKKTIKQFFQEHSKNTSTSR